MTTGVTGKIYHCLVIDDSATDRQTALFALKNVPALECECAPSGDEGICKCRSKHFEVVVIDYHMPGKNGIETVKEISQFKPEYVIGCTSCNNPEIVRSWEEAGCQEVITNKSWPQVATKVEQYIIKAESPRK